MALGFIKKVFSFGRKEVEERPAEAGTLTQPSPSSGEPIGEADRGGVVEKSRAAAATPSGPSGHLPLKGGEEPGQPQPTPAEPPAPPEKPSVPRPEEPVPTKPEPEIVPEPRPPEIEPTPPEVPPSQPPASPEIPAPAPVEVPAPPQPDEPQPPAPEYVPDTPAPQPAPTPVEIPAPSPSPSRGGGEADRPGVAGESRTAVATPSGPSGHLPLEGGEEPRTASAGKVTVGKTVAEKAASDPRAPEPAPRQSWLQRLRHGLSRSSKELSANIAGVFTKRRLDEDTLQDLEDVLIRADLGMETALRVTDALASGRYGRDVSDAEVRAIMAEEVEKVLSPVAMPLELDLSHRPHVILVVGVNGTGKTTTIGKLAAKLVAGGLKVTLAAGDTFRAAAIEQLKIWGERTHSPVVASKIGADAAGLAYDAFEKAREEGADVLIVDTAGRLQNRAELMAELEKIVRVLGKLDPEAPHTVLQTVDATTGQNALNQVEIFRNVAGVNGLVMTKLDGTARGGILVAIAAKYKLPVYFIGVGEQVDDLEPFSASDFAKAIAGTA
jgi:fused signal recognition particle receptor